MVEYRLAKARVAGSNPVSCSQRYKKGISGWMSLFSYVRALPGLERFEFLRSGRRSRTSPGRSATSRALFSIGETLPDTKRLKGLRSASTFAGKDRRNILKHFVFSFS